MISGKAIVRHLVNLRETETNDVGVANNILIKTYEKSFSDGTGPDQVDSVYSVDREIPASTTDSVDLSGGIEDAFGATLSLLNVKCIVLSVLDDSLEPVVFGGGNFQAFFKDATDKITVSPGDSFSIFSSTGWTVTPSTADILQIENESVSNPAKYQLIILGNQ